MGRRLVAYATAGGLLAGAVLPTIPVIAIAIGVIIAMEML